MLRPLGFLYCGLVSFRFSDCNIVERIKANNNMPFCQSEAEAYIYHVSNLVDDLKPGIVSKDDSLMQWKAYAPDSELTGTYKYTLHFYVFP